jgi:hypothetical protein
MMPRNSLAVRIFGLSKVVPPGEKVGACPLTSSTRTRIVRTKSSTTDVTAPVGSATGEATGAWPMLCWSSKL